MESDRFQEVSVLARDVRELLLHINPKGRQLRPSSYEPTIAESVALALLELDQIASEAGFNVGTMPTFANDFLNRRLSKRLLERYRGSELLAEFDRRLTDALQRLASRRKADRSEIPIDRIHRLLTDLELKLLQRHRSFPGR